MVVCLVAVFGYLNHRFVRPPVAIGITAIGVVVSIGAVVLARFDAAVATEMRLAVARIDFPAVLLHGVLGLLLIAGSLHIDIRDLAKEKWLILSLATFGVVASTALVGAGFFTAEKLDVSAPIAVVLMGLIVGNRGRKDAMSDETLKRVFGVWEVLDELMNLVLFGFIGLEMMTLTFSVDQVVVAAAGIVIFLVARLVSVGAPILVTPRLREFTRAAIAIMTWGGLRGGISIALALSLPEFEGRDVVISTAYVVFIFSIPVQATTLHKVIKVVLPAKDGTENPAPPGV